MTGLVGLDRALPGLLILGLVKLTGLLRPGPVKPDLLNPGPVKPDLLRLGRLKQFLLILNQVQMGLLRVGSLNPRQLIPG